MQRILVDFIASYHIEGCYQGKMAVCIFCKAVQKQSSIEALTLFSLHQQIQLMNAEKKPNQYGCEEKAGNETSIVVVPVLKILSELSRQISVCIYLCSSRSSFNCLPYYSHRDTVTGHPSTPGLLYFFCFFFFRLQSFCACSVVLHRVKAC